SSSPSAACMAGVGDGHPERPAPHQHRPSGADVGAGWDLVVLRALFPAQGVELASVAWALAVGARDDEHTVIRARFDVDGLEPDDARAVTALVDRRGAGGVMADAAQRAGRDAYGRDMRGRRRG